ncbi:fibronectin type III domain-containing protein [Planctomycetota bacterium]
MHKQNNWFNSGLFILGLVILSMLVTGFDGCPSKWRDRNMDMMTGSSIPAQAPTGLIAQGASSAQIDLTWTDNADNEDGFLIETSLDGINFTQLASVGPNTTAYSASYLDASTTYYFRIRAYNGKGFTDYSLIVTVTTDDSAPHQPDVVDPLNNALYQILTPTLDWSVPHGTQPITYMLYVDDDIDFTSLVITQANLADSHYEVQPGDNLDYDTTYYWKVQAVNTLGSTWSDDWNFKTGIPPSVPELVSPVSGTTGQVMPVTLNWNDAATGSPPITYQLQIDDNSNFASPEINQTGLASSQYTASSGLSGGTVYFWRVRAVNHLDTSAWSDPVWNFTTWNQASIPNLTSPNDEDTDQSLTLTLKWDDSSGTQPITYTLQVDDNGAFSSPEIDETNMSITQYAVTGIDNLDYDTTYSWRVMAHNAFGSSNWSDVRTFTTVIPASVPLLTSPANTAEDQSVTLQLNWSVSTGTPPITYTLQVAANGDFGDCQINETATSPHQATLVTDTAYSWRVMAHNIISPSNWSEIWTFTTTTQTDIAPSIPVLVSPADSAPDQFLDLTLNWDDSSGSQPITYTLQVDDNGDFSSPAISKTTGSDTFYAVQLGDNLVSNTTYSWQVQAHNAISSSDWSDIQTFTTGEPASVPGLTSPVDEDTDQSLTLTLKWDDASGSLPITYTVQVDDSGSGFPSPEFTQTNLSVTQTVASGLAYNTNYSWRVQANNIISPSNWSEIWTFTTVSPASVPVLDSPEDDAEDQSLTLDLAWFVSTGTLPITYTLQVAENGDFDGSLKVDVITDSPYTVLEGTLTTDTNYSWRVMAHNIVSPSNWSEIWTFTTVTEEGSTAPSTPILIYLANATTNVFPFIILILDWSDSEGDEPITYTLEVDHDVNFTGPIWVTQTDLATSQSTFIGLAANTTYYWRVKAHNANGDSVWSDVWWFESGDGLE